MAFRDLMEQYVQQQQLQNQMKRQAAEQFTPSAGQVANVLGMFAPGAASLESAGQYSSMGPYDQPFSEAFSNPPNPSMAENIERGGFGGYGMAGAQALGVLGDATYAASPVIGATLGTALKFPAALATVAKTISTAGKGGITSLKVQKAQDLISQGKATAGTNQATQKMVAPTNIEKGKIIDVRKNLNSSFDDPDLAKFKAQTIHDVKTLKSGKISDSESNIGTGTALSYDPAVTVKSNGVPIQLKVNQNARDSIASKTKPKFPMASVRGIYDDLDIFEPDLTLGFNPMKQNVFVDPQGYGVKSITNGKASIVDNDVLVKLDNPNSFRTIKDADGSEIKLYDDIEYYGADNLPKTNNPSEVKVLSADKGILPLDKTSRLQRAKDMGFRTDEPVYHGTHSKDIDAFDDKFIGNRDEGFFGRGHYFTSESGEASYYGPNVGEYYTRGKLLDLSQTKKNSNYEIEDKDYFKFWTKELDKLDMLDEPTKKGLKTINKIDDYVDNNVKFIKASDNRGNDGIAAYVKDPTKTDDLERIYSNFGVADKETAIKSLKNNIINWGTQYNSNLRKLYPNTDNILYSLSDYIRVGGKGAEELSKQAKKAGYDGIKVGDETVIFDPKNIRSKDAEFDPKKTESPNLQSSLGKPPTGGIRALSYSDKNQLA